MTTVPPDGPGTPDGEDSPPPLTEAEIEKFMSELDATPDAPAPDGDLDDTPPGARRGGAGAREPGTPQPGAADRAPERYALVFTPAASATDLARACRMARIDTLVVPTSTGAIATRHLAAPAPRNDWDISELLGSTDDTELPSEATRLAADLSRLLRHPVVLVVASLATDAGVESGLSGHVSATRWEKGEPVGDISPGLLLAQADDVAEDLVLGRLRPRDARGVVDSTTVSLGPRGLFGRRRGEGGEVDGPDGREDPDGRGSAE